LVFHIRKNADSRYDSIVGGNPIENRKTPGTLYIFAQNRNDYWCEVLLRSCAQSFKNAKRISGNIALPPVPEGATPFFDNPSEEENNRLELLRKLSVDGVQAKITIMDGFEQRFLAKLALGLGISIFGEPFEQSEYSKALRNALWEKDVKKRQEYGVQFHSYFAPIEKLQPIFCLIGAHTILLYPQDDQLLLVLFPYGMRMLVILMSPDSQIWKNWIGEGRIYIVAPQISLSTEALPLVEYLTYRTGNCKHDVLDAIMTRRFDPSKLPKITD